VGYLVLYPVGDLPMAGGVGKVKSVLSLQLGFVTVPREKEGGCVVRLGALRVLERPTQAKHRLALIPNELGPPNSLRPHLESYPLYVGVWGA
jgi:hypothetical protein